MKLSSIEPMVQDENGVYYTQDSKQHLNRWINCKSAFMQANHLDGWSTHVYCFAKSAKEYMWKKAQFEPDRNYRINAYYQKTV